VLLTLLLVPTAIGAADLSGQCVRMAADRYRSIVTKRLESVRPYRRESPLRYLNITDEETREVESAAAEVTGTEWISIGPVVTGCPCEDGEKCTDQVWVQTHQNQGAIGLLLSKVDGHWEIGSVQRLWLRYEKLRAEMDRAHTYDKYKALEQQTRQLLHDFPKCGLDKEEMALYRDKILEPCLRGNQ
jgi:hypothetical protein